MNGLRLEAERHFYRGEWPEAARLNPLAYRYQFLLGEVRFKMRQFGLAEAHYLRALRIRPNSLDAASNLALTRARQGEIGRAIDIYQKILAVWPQHREARDNLALLRSMEQAS